MRAIRKADYINRAEKSFISRIENAHSDIHLSTLYKLIAFGLGMKINFTIQ